MSQVVTYLIACAVLLLVAGWAIHRWLKSQSSFFVARKRIKFFSEFITPIFGLFGLLISTGTLIFLIAQHQENATFKNIELFQKHRELFTNELKIIEKNDHVSFNSPNKVYYLFFPWNSMKRVEPTHVGVSPSVFDDVIVKKREDDTYIFSLLIDEVRTTQDELVTLLKKEKKLTPASERCLLNLMIFIPFIKERLTLSADKEKNIGMFTWGSFYTVADWISILDNILNQLFLFSVNTNYEKITSHHEDYLDYAFLSYLVKNNSRMLGEQKTLLMQQALELQELMFKENLDLPQLKEHALIAHRLIRDCINYKQESFLSTVELNLQVLEHRSCSYKQSSPDLVKLKKIIKRIRLSLESITGFRKVPCETISDIHQGNCWERVTVQ
ncbi:hypothetical protein [Halodesulfovibrio aestuarii]|uniref:Uncharacterized protein n=1 Tax=Halodesulfovibrio aestuarii TaxID=126333 RepID=A0ABV4JUK0_9BACT